MSAVVGSVALRADEVARVELYRLPEKPGDDVMLSWREASEFSTEDHPHFATVVRSHGPALAHAALGERMIEAVLPALSAVEADELLRRLARKATDAAVLRAAIEELAADRARDLGPCLAPCPRSEDECAMHGCQRAIQEALTP